MKEFWLKDNTLSTEFLALYLGWYAHRILSVRHRKLRHPCTGPKIRTFDPFREDRAVVFTSLDLFAADSAGVDGRYESYAAS